YLATGVATLPLCFWLGPWLLRQLTNKEYVVSGVVIGCIAATRFVQNLALLLQMTFAVHHRMAASLTMRVAGALVAVPVCWWAIRTGGMGGAAYGALASGIVFVLLQTFAPGGCFWLIRAARNEATRNG